MLALIFWAPGALPPPWAEPGVSKKGLGCNVTYQNNTEAYVASFPYARCGAGPVEANGAFHVTRYKVLSAPDSHRPPSLVCLRFRGRAEYKSLTQGWRRPLAGE